jgi:hypothetical protein
MFPSWEHILWCAQRMALVRWKNGLKGGKNEAFEGAKKGRIL